MSDGMGLGWMCIRNEDGTHEYIIPNAYVKMAGLEALRKMQEAKEREQENDAGD